MEEQMIKLSHSAKELYNRCPKAYYIHYMLHLRRKVMGSALPFGSAMDAGLEVLLKEKNPVQAKVEFINKWNNFEINKKMVVGKDATLRYFKADMDEKLFTKDETPTNHESLMRKGLMFLDAYNEQIIPKIKKVIGTQIPITIKNPDGDEIVGFIDLKCEWEDGRVLILDNKTASANSYREHYPDNILETDKAAQVVTYGLGDKEHDAIGYIVINKEIRKIKEPKVQIKTIIGKVSKEIVQKTIDNYDQVLHSIREAQFPSKNPDCFAFGEECTCQLFEREGYKAFDYLTKDKR